MLIDYKQAAQFQTVKLQLQNVAHRPPAGPHVPTQLLKGGAPIPHDNEDRQKVAHAIGGFVGSSAFAVCEGTANMLITANAIAILQQDLENQSVDRRHFISPQVKRIEIYRTNGYFTASSA